MLNRLTNFGIFVCQESGRGNCHTGSDWERANCQRATGHCDQYSQLWSLNVHFL